MVKAIMHGCNGKMGQMITKLARETHGIEIVAGVDVTDGDSNPYPVFHKLEDCGTEADVVIDFASAKAVDALLDYCVGRKIPCVLCTTGLSAEQLERVKAASEQVAILRSANMSMGINLLLKLLKEAAPVLADVLRPERRAGPDRGGTDTGRVENAPQNDQEGDGGYRKLLVQYVGQCLYDLSQRAG